MNKVFPKTLDIMADDAPHVLNITQQIQSSINLFIWMKQAFKDHEPFVQADLNKKYFSFIIQAIESSETSNLKDQKEKAESTEDEVQRNGMLA